MLLSKTLYPLLSTGSTKKTFPDITEKLLTEMKRIKTKKDISRLSMVQIKLFFSLIIYIHIFVNEVDVLISLRFGKYRYVLIYNLLGTSL